MNNQTYTPDYTQPATRKQMEYLKILRPNWDWSEPMTMGQASCEIDDIKKLDEWKRKENEDFKRFWNSLSEKERQDILDGNIMDAA